MKLLKLISFLLVAYLHTESNFCTLLYLAFKHNTSTKSLCKLFRSSKANPNTTLFKYTLFAIIKSGEKIFDGIRRNPIASIYHLCYYVAPFAIVLTV